ncbi:hypothetical protein B0H13DRAFT_1602108, partial [Mycena leptocephala]
QEPWDQEHFEHLLGKFIVATDQPFTLVEEPEFGELLQYVDKHTGRVLEIPKEKSVKGKTMKMGDELEKKLTAMFAVSVFSRIANENGASLVIEK